jgi:hypothetical protein
MSDRPAGFTDRLLAELLPLVGSANPTVPAPPVRVTAAPARRSSTRRLVVLGCAGTLTAMAGLATAALWPHRLAAAYAVESQPDGSVVVTVNDLSDPVGLEDLLVADKVPATVLVVRPGAECPQRVANTVPAPGAIQGHPGARNIVTIRPRALPAGSRAVLGLTQTEDGQITTLFTVVDGPAPSCFPGSVPVHPTG